MSKMQWLIAHMWTALAATGVLGLLFGWAVRGLRLRGKLRKAEGERNIAQGALSEKEAELEALYAAGREPANAAETAAPAESSEFEQEFQGAIAERDEKLQALADELARSKAEVNELRSQSASSGGQDISAKAVGTAVAGMAVGAAMSGDTDNQRLDANLDEEEATLEWRNRYLESRVRTLEEKIKEVSAGTLVTDGGADAAVPVGAASDVSDVNTTAPGDAELVKLKWKANYLQERINYFETYGPPGLASGVAVAVAPVTVGDAEAGETSTSDEEIASLRWRNRYLEGRLAYYEGDKAIDDEADSGIAELAQNSATIAEPEDPSVEEPPAANEVEMVSEIAPNEDIDIVVDEAEAEPETVSETADSGSDVDAPIEEDGAEAERGVQPMALDGPVNGEGDDLTAIGGIGPKIQEVLNGFGVYHYDQIAAWTPENVAWVDDHLAFEGRIEREQWVQQAEALSNVS